MIKQWMLMLLLTATLFSKGTSQLVPQRDVQGTMYLVNRDLPISKNYVPPVQKAQVPGSSTLMRKDAAMALEKMFAAAKEEAGIIFTATSGYRSYSRQKTIYQNKINKVGSAKKANNYVAPAGTSEHQLGLAMDVGAKGVNVGLNGKFGQTQAGLWVAQNGHRFGFIIRYQEGWEEITGYRYEPWHIRYVGVEQANSMYKGHLPMEEYAQTYQMKQLTYFLTWEGEEKTIERAD